MKKTIIILITLAAIFTTCKKEDRDEIFESRTHRYLTGGWNLDKIIINGIDSTSILLNNDTLGHRFIFIYNRSVGKYSNDFICYSKLSRMDGFWELKKNEIVTIDLYSRNFYIYNGMNVDTVVNRWIYEGDWIIKEIKKDKLILHFKNNIIEYEYSFLKSVDL